MRRLKKLLFNLFALLWVALATGTGVLWARSYRAQAPMAPHAAGMQTVLARRLPQFRLDGISLVDSTDFLGDVSGQPITVDWKTLDEARITHDTPVSMRLRDARTGEVLARMVSVNNDLECVANGEVIRISTKAAFAAARRAGVRDLASPDNWPAPAPREGTGSVAVFRLAIARVAATTSAPRRTAVRNAGWPWRLRITQAPNHRDGTAQTAPAERTPRSRKSPSSLLRAKSRFAT
ncbi:MAG: hypothetical protein ACHRHE_22180 [Tepidisphaerales bacterium]